MDEVRSIRILSADGTIEEGLLAFSNREPATVSLTWRGQETQVCEAIDVFAAFWDLRVYLEGMGCRLLCKGACLNVWPSGMSRSMGGGRKAYRMVMGKPTVSADLVDIFDDASPEEVVDTKSQKRFHDEWGESLRRR